jgi:hypothetical protein
MRSQINKNKEASERQPSDKVGARGKQCNPFWPGEASGTEETCINRRKEWPPNYLRCAPSKVTAMRQFAEERLCQAWRVPF